MLLGILREGEESVLRILARFELKPEQLRRKVEGERSLVDRVSSTADLPLAEETKRILANAANEAERMSHPSVGSAHLLIGILEVEGCLAVRILTKAGLELDSVREELAITAPDADGIEAERKEWPFLAEYGRDLTSLAASDKFDPLIGRVEEVDRIVQVLSRRTKNNPILLGEPGVGKTAIVEGLAQRIAQDRVPIFLRSREIIALDLSLIVAGTKYRGQFEERLKGILKELEESRHLIVFIDEIHSLIGAGSAEGSLDAANILKPALSRGEISCIGATTLKEYRKYIEKDRSLLRRFQAVQVLPPSDEETFLILDGIKDRYESFHRVRYDNGTLRAAVRQSNRYIPDRFQPDKAIDVLDEAGAKVKLRRVADVQQVRELEDEVKDVETEMKAAISEKDFERAVYLREKELEQREDLERINAGLGESSFLTVTPQDIDEVIAAWTGVPVTSPQREEADRLLGMEDSLRRWVVGQDRAIEAICRAIRRSRLGVGNPQRPVGSFVFLGSSGVGKTELARRLAEFLFDSQNALIRFDMSEFMEKHTASKLIGSPPGYVGHEEGGQLTERVRRRPYSIVLFDEIEKAHSDVSNLLLQILDDGRLTDAYGNSIDFTNTIVLMTSNVGSKFVGQGSRMGFGEVDEHEGFRRLEKEILSELGRCFSPEFINRVDEVIVFNPLGQEHLRQIVDILLGDVNETLRSRGLHVAVGPEACDWLLKAASVTSLTGARPLRRTIQRHIQDAVSELLIARRGEQITAIVANVIEGREASDQSTLELEVESLAAIPAEHDDARTLARAAGAEDRGVGKD